MNLHLQHGLILLQQGRNDLAEKELRQALALDPESFLAHVALADCLSNLERFEEAIPIAEQAIRLEPDASGAHAALARALFGSDRCRAAEIAIHEAIRLDPYDSNHFALLGLIRHAQSDWAGALAASDDGLLNDPEHVGCLNVRAMALTKLGRRAEAAHTTKDLLALDPEDSLGHANEGWRLLHEGNSRQALEHFRESLRLDPGNEFARLGMIEALKARNPLYGLMLRYFLWMSGLQRGVQLAILIGALIAQQVLSRVADAVPALKPFVIPLLIAYFAFAVMTWCASPLCNLTLMLSRFGRQALLFKEKVEALIVGAILLGALAGLLFWAVVNIFGMLIALYFCQLVMPTISTLRCVRFWPKVILGAVTVGLAVLGAYGLLEILAHPKGAQAFLYFSRGVLITVLAGQFLRLESRVR